MKRVTLWTNALRFDGDFVAVRTGEVVLKLMRLTITRSLKLRYSRIIIVHPNEQFLCSSFPVHILSKL